MREKSANAKCFVKRRQRRWPRSVWATAVACVCGVCGFEKQSERSLSLVSVRLSGAIERGRQTVSEQPKNSICERRMQAAAAGVAWWPPPPPSPHTTVIQTA